MTNPNESYITASKDGATVFNGPDATNLFRAVILKNALATYAKTEMLMTRGLTATGMLRSCKEYTGKTYKRGEHAKAAQDMQVWIATMKAALPCIKE